jgi:hypothetical protein
MSILYGNYLGQKSKLTNLQEDIDVTRAFIDQIPVEEAQATCQFITRT